MDCSKSQREFFEKIIQELKCENPAEIMFWDDDGSKVELAKSLGIQAFLYEKFEDFEDKMRQEGLLHHLNEIKNK